MAVVPVLLVGGVGTRLWPMSTPSRPKQFQELTGEVSMLRQTVRRLSGLGASDPVVVCNTAHVETALTDLGLDQVSPSLVIAEPVGRSTGPAVLLAALAVDREDILLVLPADHVIADEAGFRRAAEEACSLARQGFLVTFGVVPSGPETGYGYIRTTEAATASPVDEFVEKPDRATAARFVSEGLLWNSGMFAFAAGVISDEFRRHAPELWDPVSAAMAASTRSGASLIPGERFEESPTISIDHAVMEKTDRAMVVRLDAGWSDVGSWDTLYRLGPKDEGRNVTQGEVALVDVSDSYVRSATIPIAVVGLSGVIVVQSPEGIVVSSRERSQDVKQAAILFDSE